MKSIYSHKSVLLILFLSVFVNTVVFSFVNAELTYSEAINKAGRQRMLSQRITKTYCQIGIGIKPEVSKQQLLDAINLFSSQLEVLENFSTETETAELIDKIKLQWTPFKELALSAPTKKNISQLVEMDENLLQKNEHLVQKLVAQSGNKITRLVNISGRQRMLSQRIAKFYLLKAWGQHTPATEIEMERAINEFSGAIESLLQAPENTFSIIEKLDIAKTQWTWLYSSLNFSENEFFPLIVVDASEKLLNNMEMITDMYQKIAMQ